MSREWRIDEDGDLALWVDGKHDSGNGQRIAGCLRATNGWTLTTANGYQRFVSDSGDIDGEVIKADQT